MRKEPVLKKTLIYTIAMMLCVVLLSGCGGPGRLEDEFAKIVVSKTNSTEVMTLLPEPGMLHTTDSVSVLNKKSFLKEVGIVRFNSDDSLVRRKSYLKHRSRIKYPPFVTEELYLYVQTRVSDKVLAEPYESDVSKNIAILRYCHDAMIEDGRAFNEDQATVRLIGLARTGLGVGIQQLISRPREADLLTSDKGFFYTHPTLGKCRLYLTHESDDVFTVTVKGSDFVDPFDTW